MTKEELIELLSSKFKLIRVEVDYTQDKMAEILGISKKTLVQIEKGRIHANWTTTVALCALFRTSSILESTLGDSPIEILETIAHENILEVKEKTLGGHVWWREINSSELYKLQQNIISKHYRIINHNDYRIGSSFNKEEIEAFFIKIK
ncbi:DNA-binding XRE family transcriptional regulator [Bacillus mesophilus]|uniref:Helix-turn-helix domain-containing protein n=1 Tax=Bacillus mesophilus TaxID=1808955 RepID=A0A6M0Q6I2_9BACI|nr:helix-turn-helix domain-containing protein [Bacillus mesophilus]MBM7660504.1 DNA-binding XRE family transcriptional regulator [Bacillus mesophilus]NEY71946.1 helix-turn-helix domain-containing protein [Bacillus mesophilus]